MNSLDKQLLPVMKYAWEEIMKIYDSWDFDANQKDDWSPVTRADKLANAILSEAVIKVFDSPILSEEDIMPSFEERSKWTGGYWVFDPIDGTRGFLNKNWEFCICVSYMVNHRPVYAVIYDPQKQVFYSAEKWKWTKMHVDEKRSSLMTWDIQTAPLRFLNSRPEGHASIKKELSNIYPDIKETRMFSALKFTSIAKDEADFFMQNRATHYRDTSAWELIAQESWLNVFSTHNWDITNGINYNTPATLNNAFIVTKPWLISDALIENLLLDPKHVS